MMARVDGNAVRPAAGAAKSRPCRVRVPEAVTESCSFAATSAEGTRAHEQPRDRGHQQETREQDPDPAFRTARAFHASRHVPAPRTRRREGLARASARATRPQCATRAQPASLTNADRFRLFVDAAQKGSSRVVSRSDRSRRAVRDARSGIGGGGDLDAALAAGCARASAGGRARRGRRGRPSRDARVRRWRSEKPSCRSVGTDRSPQRRARPPSRGPRPRPLVPRRGARRRDGRAFEPG